jgi:hypothetical protein
MPLKFPKYFLLALMAWTLLGCGGAKQPTGPGGSIAPYEVRLEPSEITPPQNAQLKLFQTFPEFSQLDGKLAFFSSSSGEGFFSIDSSRVDLQVFDGSNLSPSVWYAYNGSQHNLIDTVKVEIVDLYGVVVSWNYGLILVH